MNFFKRIAKLNSHNAIIKPLAGLGRSINRFYENRNHNASTNGELTVLQKLAQINPSVVFDVGANVGDYSLLASKACPGAKIYSFEPVHSTFELLKSNLAANNLSNVVAIEKGLYKENKKININIFTGDEHASIHELKGVDYAPIGQNVIEVAAGDSVIENLEIKSIDLLKLDVEGAEMDALQGFEMALQSRKIRAIQFEYGYINITSKVLLCDYYDFFKQYGYIVGKIYPKTVEFREYSFKHEDFIGPNFLAIHESDGVLKKLLSA